jgi:hypothetical protein
MTPRTPPDGQLRHVIGVDLGKLSDFSALALLRWRAVSREPWPDPYEPFKPPPPPQAKPEYEVPTLHRWPLGTAYTEVLSGLVKFLRLLPPTLTPPLLVVDKTGVGDAVYEMVREAVIRERLPGGSVGVTITGGSAVSCHGVGLWRVAKKALVSVLQVLLGTRRLHVAPDLAEAPTLVRELGTFSVKTTEAGNESFEAWREKDHDDLVLAVALAAWAAETLNWGPPAPPMPRGVRV